jgi:hypothetical protein
MALNLDLELGTRKRGRKLRSNAFVLLLSNDHGHHIYLRFLTMTKIERTTAGGGLSEGAIDASLKTGLESLDVKQVNILYARFPDPNTPVAESTRAFGKRYRAGLFKEVCSASTLAFWIAHVLVAWPVQLLPRAGVRMDTAMREAWVCQAHDMARPLQRNHKSISTFLHSSKSTTSGFMPTGLESRSTRLFK